MTDAIIDDFLLNDDNDEDLDYDLDPKEENALLQEDSDMLDQDFEEEDVLDLNEDYDQIDGNDGADVSEKASGSVNNENNVISKTDEKTITTLNSKNIRRITKGPRRGFNRNRNPYSNGNCRSKTVLINPRFKGSVNVNSNQFPWESPQCNTFEPPRNQQLMQPWVTGNIQNYIPPQINTFNPSNFVTSNHGAFLPPQLNTNYIQPTIQQPIQPFLQPQPMSNQHLLLNQPLMQINPCPNQFHFQTPQQLPIIQQFPEPQKLPVHQRLGIASNAPQPLFTQTPNHIPFDSNQNLQPNNQFMPHQNQPGINRPEVLKFLNTKRYKKNSGNFKNNKIVKNNFVAQNKQKVPTEKLEVINKPQDEEEEKHDGFDAIIPEDEDEETREYRKKIEEQKRKREEILRKKEESRRKSLALETQHLLTKPNKTKTQNFQQKKFNFPHNNVQQNKQHKLQNYTNNIVITGNDYHQFGQRSIINSNNLGQSDRIVLFPNNIQSNTPIGTDQVNSKDISSFLCTRSVIAQDNLSQTNIVVVKNLALATNETKIMKLCEDIGKVQKLQMEKNEHQATIHFNTVASAHAFYNKFRRRMIDLSMVQVDLVPINS